jgi:hypothetical protein
MVEVRMQVPLRACACRGEVGTQPPGAHGLLRGLNRGGSRVAPLPNSPSDATVAQIWPQLDKQVRWTLHEAPSILGAAWRQHPVVRRHSRASRNWRGKVRLHMQNKQQAKSPAPAQPRLAHGGTCTSRAHDTHRRAGWRRESHHAPAQPSARLRAHSAPAHPDTAVPHAPSAWHPGHEGHPGSRWRKLAKGFGV